ITDDVDEEHIRNLQLDFLFNFGGHKARRKGSRAKGESRMDSLSSRTTRIPHRYATTEEDRFSDSFFNIVSGLNRRRCLSPYWRNRMNRSKQVPADLPANGSGEPVRVVAEFA